MSVVFPTQDSAKASVLEFLRCPNCAQSLVVGADRTRLICEKCRVDVPRIGNHIIDFLREPCREAEAILDWPSELLEAMQPHLQDLHDGNPIRAESAAILQDGGLVDATGAPTPFGRLISYHQLEKIWQKRGDSLRETVETLAEPMENPRVLDVGCGAATTLGLLERLGHAELVGLDRDLVPLALADRLRRGTDDRRLTLIRGSALALPFRDGAFTHVLSRVSLNYLPQPQALREMTRVLAAGGYLGLRIESLGFDLHGIRNAPGIRGKLGRTRDLFAGLLFNATGFALPLGRFGGQRQYASVYRLRRLLKRLGCEIVHVAKVDRSVPFWGIISQQVVLARKTKTSI